MVLAHLHAGAVGAAVAAGIAGGDRDRRPHHSELRQLNIGPIDVLLPVDAQLARGLLRLLGREVGEASVNGVDDVLAGAGDRDLVERNRITRTPSMYCRTSGLSG